MNQKVQTPEPVNEPVLSYAPGTPARAALKQQLCDLADQKLDIPLVIGGKEVPFESVDIIGEQIRFKLKGRKGEFTGQVKGKLIEGTVETGGTKAPWSASLGG